MSNSINELLGKATWRDFIYALHDDPCWSWIDPFWPWGFVLGETDDKKRFPVFKWKSQEIVPATLRRLGCSTTIEKDHPNGGELAYLLWDFDVCKGNPADAYNTPQEALDAALSLRTALGWVKSGSRPAGTAMPSECGYPHGPGSPSLTGP